MEFLLAAILSKTETGIEVCRVMRHSDLSSLGKPACSDDQIIEILFFISSWINKLTHQKNTTNHLLSTVKSRKKGQTASMHHWFSPAFALVFTGGENSSDFADGCGGACIAPGEKSKFSMDFTGKACFLCRILLLLRATNSFWSFTVQKTWVDFCGSFYADRRLRLFSTWKTSRCRVAWAGDFEHFGGPRGAGDSQGNRWDSQCGSLGDLLQARGGVVKRLWDGWSFRHSFILGGTFFMRFIADAS